MKQYTQIMFASVNHELRTPINGKLDELLKITTFLVEISDSKQSDMHETICKPDWADVL